MEKGIKFICDHCGDLIEIGRPRFILEGRLYCAYDGGEFDEIPPKSKASLEDVMKQLIAEAEKKTEKELNDEVHYPYQFDLCRKCRDRIYQALDGKFDRKDKKDVRD